MWAPKYKIGDRVFHRSLGWGVITGNDHDFSNIFYEVKLDAETFFKRVYIAEFELSKSDFLRDDIR